MSTETIAADKTCKLTIVTPGSSDRVIKVFPAEHEAEKIFLDNTPGIERWKEIERLMFQYAPRGERVPPPVAYHSSAKNLVTPEIGEHDIPVVNLDGAYLKAPAVAQRPVSNVKLPGDAVNERIAKLEDRMDRILLALEGKSVPVSEEIVKGKPGRKPKI